jgi:hypothetical protein
LLGPLVATPKRAHHAMYKVENSLKEAQLFFDWWDG